MNKTYFTPELKLPQFVRDLERKITTSLPPVYVFPKIEVRTNFDGSRTAKVTVSIPNLEVQPDGTLVQVIREQS